jgi:hypothetical protein
MVGGWTNILANKPFGALYVGVTADLAARMMSARTSPEIPASAGMTDFL